MTDARASWLATCACTRVAATARRSAAGGRTGSPAGAGRDADTLPTLLALFSLCADAHMTARCARAARGQTESAAEAVVAAQALRLAPPASICCAWGNELPRRPG